MNEPSHSPSSAEPPRWRVVLDEACVLENGRPGDAVVRAREALQLTSGLGDPIAEAKCLLIIGACEGALADYEAAITHLRRARALASEAGDDRDEAEALKELGIVHQVLGDHDEALAFYLEARPLFARGSNRLAQAGILNCIGIVHSKSGDHAQGLEFFKESMALHDPETDAAVMAHLLNNMGICLRHLGRLEEARGTLQETVRVLSASGVGCEAALSNLGRTYAAEGNLVAAEAAFRRALNPLRPAIPPQVEADALHGLGEVLTQLDRLDEARQVLERALSIAERMGLASAQLDCLLGLSRLDEKANDSAAALARFRAYHELERRIFSERSDGRLKSLQMRHRVVELERQTLEDGLTGLGNRRLFDRELKAELARARRHGRALALALCDLDDFKGINDRFSHLVGDQVLREAARRLAAACDPDLVARYGGEEFALILPDAAGAARICERARQAIEAVDWEAIQPGLRVTTSIGLAVSGSTDVEADLLRRADEKLYEAKRAGKNRVVA